MATTFSGSLTIDLTSKLSDAGTHTNFDVVTKLGTGGLTAVSKSLTDGTTANKAQRDYSAQFTVTAGSNQDVDLYSLTDRRGQALSFAKVKWVFVRLTSPVTGGYLVMGGSGPANPWTALFADASDKMNIGDIFLYVNQIDGLTVDATHRNLRFNNPTGSSITFDLIVVGN